MPAGMDVLDQPVAFNGKLYMRSRNRGNVTVLVYTPDRDQWTALPCPPVEDFTIATVRGQLLVVGGIDKSTVKITNTILTFDERFQRWIQSLPAIPTPQTLPKVIEYHDHLIVTDQQNSNETKVLIVNILDTSNNKWKPIQRFIITHHVYDTLLIEDAMYLEHMCPLSYLEPSLVCGRHFQMPHTISRHLSLLAMPS